MRSGWSLQVERGGGGISAPNEQAERILDGKFSWSPSEDGTLKRRPYTRRLRINEMAGRTKREGSGAPAGSRRYK